MEMRGGGGGAAGGVINFSSCVGVFEHVESRAQDFIPAC